jgi:hypothetical protein
MLVPSPARLRAPEKQWVTTSPGRSAFMISSISAKLRMPPMWTMIFAGRPESSQASIARSSGSIPISSPRMFSDMRTFAPSTKSGFSAIARAQASTRA